MVGEQELRQAAVAGVRQWPAWRPNLGDVVDEVKDLLIEWDHAFIFEFAEWDFEPAALAGDFVHAVQLEVE